VDFGEKVSHNVVFCGLQNGACEIDSYCENIAESSDNFERISKLYILQTVKTR